MSGKLESVQQQLYDESVKLLKLVSHLYYDDYVAILISTLTQLDLKKRNNVTEADLVNELPLVNKQVRNLLYQLEADGLIRKQSRVDTADGADRASRGILGVKGARITSRATTQNTWYIDSERLVNAIKYKHATMLNMLNKQIDYTDQFYYCPNPECPNHTQNISVLDLLTKHAYVSEFVCDQCKYYDAEKDVQLPTPLEARVENDFQQISTRNDRLKEKFNVQLKVLFDQLNVVNDLLIEVDKLNDIDLQRFERTEREKRLAKQTGGSLASAYTFQSDESVDAAEAERRAAAAAASLSASTAQPATATAASNAGIGAPTAGIVLNKKPAAQVNKRKEPLPWARYTDKGDDGEQKKEGDESAVAVKRMKQEEIDESYAEKYKAELVRQLKKQQEMMIKSEPSSGIGVKTENGHTNGHTAVKAEAGSTTAAQPTIKAEQSSNTASATDTSMQDVMLTVQGQPMPLSEITQDDVDLMTDEELKLYEMAAFVDV